MLVQFYLYSFLGICLALMIWGLIRLERIYQYPFFMGSIFLTFVYPQATALINNRAFVTETALERVLLMSSLCAAMCWVGYIGNPNQKLLQKLEIPVDNDKLLKAGIVVTLIGLVFNNLTTMTFRSGSVQNLSQPSGVVTIYIFFGKVIYVGFAILLIQLLKKPSVISFCGTLIAGIPLWQTVVAGKRQTTITVLIIIGFSLWQYRGLLPPRWLIAILIFLGFYLIPLLGELRFKFWELVLEQNWDALSSKAQESFNELQEGDVLELRNAALAMDSVEFFGQYQWGTGYWDWLVSQYVPGQLLGFDFKRSLMFNLGEREIWRELYGYQAQIGTTLTGMADSYQQFGYFGCLVFALIGHFFKTLWIASVEQKSVIATLLMVGCIGSAMIGVTHGTGRFLQEAVFQVIVISLIAYYAGDKKKLINPKET